MSEITIDNGWLLDKDMAESQVIEGNQVRLYRESAIVAYLDGSFESAALSASNPTPVRNDEGKLIGHALLRVHNRKLVADMVIDYSTPERLAAETRDGVRHYARAIGTLVFRNCGDGMLDFAQQPVLRMEVDALVLSTTRPTDPKLLAFGEPLLL